MIVKCHFCMKNAPVKKIVGPSTATGPTVFELCQQCADEKEAADKMLGVDLLEMKYNDTSNLCVGCGVCCFALQIRVSRNEVERVVEDHKVDLDTFAGQSKDSPLLPDHFSMKTPCIFLLGKPLSGWTACRIHEKYRPEICGSYLCKMAIRYQLGTISLNEARYWLRTAILSRDFSIFNWVSDPAEAKVLISAAIANRIARLRKDGLGEEEIKLAVASIITPKYLFKSEASELVLDMHFATADRGDFDPKVFFSEEELEDSHLSKMSPTQIVEMTIKRVVETFRSYFVQDGKTPMEKLVSIDEEKMDELRISVEGESG